LYVFIQIQRHYTTLANAFQPFFRQFIRLLTLIFAVVQNINVVNSSHAYEVAGLKDQNLHDGILVLTTQDRTKSAANFQPKPLHRAYPQDHLRTAREICRQMARFVPNSEPVLRSRES